MFGIMFSSEFYREGTVYDAFNKYINMPTKFYPLASVDECRASIYANNLFCKRRHFTN